MFFDIIIIVNIISDDFLLFANPVRRDDFKMLPD